MKLRDALMLPVTLLACTSLFSQNVEKLSPDKVDQNKVKFAQGFGDRYFCAARDGKTYEFQNDATAALIQGFTPEVQKQVYQDIRIKYGDYKSMEYIESWKYTAGEIMTIVRFKGIFGNGQDKPEIRLVIDGADKVAGFWYKPWADELK